MASTTTTVHRLLLLSLTAWMAGCGGGGGGGSEPGCQVAADCAGTDTTCRVRTCAGGACGHLDLPVGTLVAGQQPGDCHRVVCDGAGAETSVVDATDVSDDGNLCTVDACAAGAPVNTPAVPGTSCQSGGGVVCDGGGACVECLINADCPSGLCAGGVCVAASCGDAVVQAGEQCDDGNLVNDDACTNLCRAPACGDGITQAGEQCDDGNLVNDDLCTNACRTAACGDGIVQAGEACDDGNAAGGDGCAATCAVETAATCAPGSPSVCAAHEWQCGDQVDNDGDLLTDGNDPDCALPGYFAACAAGQQLLVLGASGPPVAIPDGLEVSRTVRFPGATGTIQRMVLLVDITHPVTRDLTLTFNNTATIANKIGFGADYAETLFDNGCATNVNSGAPPYRGCYQPNQLLPATGGVAGAWSLLVADTSANGSFGTFNRMVVAVCAGP